MIVCDFEEMAAEPEEFEFETVARIAAAEARRDPRMLSKTDQEKREIMKAIAEHTGGDKMLLKDEAVVGKFKDPLALAKHWQHNRLRFATRYFKLRGPDGKPEKIVLERFQRKVLRWEYDWLILLKARRIGGTFGWDLDALADSHLQYAIDSYFISINLTLARDRMSNIMQIWDMMPKNVRRKRIGSGFKAKIDFLHRDGKGISSIRSHPQTEPRGWEGNFHLDEVAKMHDQQGLIRAANYGISRVGKLTLTSTPRAIGDYFHHLIELHEKANKADADKDSIMAGKKVRFLRVPWWESVAMVKPGLWDEAQERCPGMPTERRIVVYGSDKLRGIFEFMDSSIEDFQMEEECIFLDEANAYYNFDLRRRSMFDPCTGDDYDLTVEVKKKKDRKRSLVEQHMMDLRVPFGWYYQLDDLFRANQRGMFSGEFYLGIDPGDGDGFALVLWERIGEMVVDRFHIKFRKKDLGNVDTFKMAEEYVLKILKHLNVKRVAVDVRIGDGKHIVNSMRSNGYPGHRIVQIMATANSNYDMAADARVRMDAGMLGYPDEEGIRHDRKYTMDGDFSKVHRVKLNNGNITIFVPRDKTGHGDCFYAGVYSLSTMPAFKKPRVTTRPAKTVRKSFPKQQFVPKRDLVSTYKKKMRRKRAPSRFSSVVPGGATMFEFLKTEKNMMSISSLLPGVKF